MARVRDLTIDEGRKLLSMIRRGSGSVVRWRRAQIVLWSAQRMDVPAIARIAFTSEDRVRAVIQHERDPKYRKVRCSDAFTAKAKAMFPPDGSSTGRPNYRIFAETVLLLAAISFGRDFERYGSGIAVFTTAETVFFRPPMNFYARLIADGREVELIDLEVDDDWTDWDQILDEDDPQ